MSEPQQDNNENAEPAHANLNEMARQAIFQISPPSEFNFTHPGEWPQWFTLFQHFRQASGLDKQPQDRQVNTSLYAMATEAETIVCSRNLTTDELMIYDTVS
jgi:hypothetical protein